MTDALALIQNVYAAFGRGDIPALLALTAPDVDWQFHGDHGAGYTGHVRGHAQVGEWFGEVARLGGNLDGLVPEDVARALATRARE